MKLRILAAIAVTAVAGVVVWATLSAGGFGRLPKDGRHLTQVAADFPASAWVVASVAPPRALVGALLDTVSVEFLERAAERLGEETSSETQETSPMAWLADLGVDPQEPVGVAFELVQNGRQEAPVLYVSLGATEASDSGRHVATEIAKYFDDTVEIRTHGGHDVFVTANSAVAVERDRILIASADYPTDVEVIMVRWLEQSAQERWSSHPGVSRLADLGEPALVTAASTPRALSDEQRRELVQLGWPSKDLDEVLGIAVVLLLRGDDVELHGHVLAEGRVAEAWAEMAPAVNHPSPRQLPGPIVAGLTTRTDLGAILEEFESDPLFRDLLTEADRELEEAIDMDLEDLTEALSGTAGAVLLEWPPITDTSVDIDAVAYVGATSQESAENLVRLFRETAEHESGVEFDREDFSGTTAFVMDGGYELRNDPAIVARNGTIWLTTNDDLLEDFWDDDLETLERSTPDAARVLTGGSEFGLWIDVSSLIDAYGDSLIAEGYDIPVSEIADLRASLIIESRSEPGCLVASARAQRLVRAIELVALAALE